MNRAQRVIVGGVISGVVVIAGIGFAGSYAAVRDLAVRKGFGTFAHVFPIGVDAGIVVLLALDLLVTWLRIPFPLLRHTAWLLTGATIAFNGAVAWPDPLGVGMHGVIPLLFVVAVEAARHSVGRLANITAGQDIEPVRLIRWLLSPAPTFVLWRRMKLWELRSYDSVIKLEQERLVYKARLRSRFGRAWRRKAPVEELLPLRFARYGVPLSEGQDLAAPAGHTPAEGSALEAHVTGALAIASSTQPAASIGPGMNVPSPPAAGARAVESSVNPGTLAKPGSEREAVNGVNGVNGMDRALDRERGTVKPRADVNVKPPVHAFTAFTADPVNGSWKSASRSSVNGREGSASSRLSPVNQAHVNTVKSVKPQVTASVNGFTPSVKLREFTPEGVGVNRADWTVKQAFTLRVNDTAKREAVGVSGWQDTVKPLTDETVKGHADERETPAVNHGAAGVNVDGANSRRPMRPQAASGRKREAVHAVVGRPNRFKAERARRAAEWFAAKEADPDLTQRAFAQSIGRSEAWVSKLISEALDDDGGTADG
ncbi:DUF2637 domain-containing protein [Streptomyces sp. NPDC101191]|uniref:DUF2637 domain-containing protein n=1 Tax=Streptomyces sp. NPDC101191 TaxID=3366126 RepID=UPI003827DC9B